MVMEATPSPQSVGREFVRQYYTLLNKAPHHLHRFYNHQSSFVHGGLEPANSTRPDCLVIGQKQIHNKIQQLNFRDCHAKISQVDAQATLGSGVVVQVTGELSNDGQPMRRFTQTFVLAAQAPKKYYVHNDIFRYQDMVWDEDQQQTQDGGEQDSDARSEEVNDTEGVPPVDMQQQGQPPVDMQQQQVHHAVLQQGGNAQVPSLVVAGDAAQVVHQQQVAAGQMFYNAGAVKPAPGMFPAAAPLNGHPQQQQQPASVVPAVAPAQQQAPAVIMQQQAPISEPAQAAAVAPSAPAVDSKQPVIVDEVAKEKVAPTQSVVEEAVVEKKPPQPETFASLVKSGGGASGRVLTSRGPGAAPVQPVSVVSPVVQQQQQNVHSGSQHNTNNSSGGVGGGNVRERRSSTNNNSSGQSYGDSQQLFVGNIPHHATEEELKAMFSKYGVVLDLRIFTKQSNALPAGGKGATGRVPQNYGFVTFKESESAQAVLANTNISFPDDSPDGQKLNIEEKMQRVGDRDRRSMGGSMNGGGGGMGNGGPRGMGRGGGGGGGMGGVGGGMRNSGPRGSDGRDGRDGRNGTGPRGGSGAGGGGSYNRSQIIRNGSAGGGGGGGGSGLTASGSGNTYGGRR